MSILRIAVLVLLTTGLGGCFTFNPKRCKIPNCHVRMVHAHGGEEFRGRPWWRRNQNLRIGQNRGIRHEPATKNPEMEKPPSRKK